METSAISLAGAELRASRRHAIIYVLSASATFTLGSAVVKALTADFPVLEIVMFRSLVGFVAMLPMILRHGGLSALATRRPVGHVMRTVYGFIDRQNLPGLFRTFDFASPDYSTPQRHTTTVPQQALFLLNGPFVVEQAKALAARPDVVARTEPGERIGYLYRLLYGRAPDAEEATLGQRFIGSAGAEMKLSAWEKYCQVLLLSNEFAFMD